MWNQGAVVAMVIGSIPVIGGWLRMGSCTYNVPVGTLWKLRGSASAKWLSLQGVNFAGLCLQWVRLWEKCLLSWTFEDTEVDLTLWTWICAERPIWAESPRFENSSVTHVTDMACSSAQH
jgi:hypothetical protein